MVKIYIFGVGVSVARSLVMGNARRLEERDE